MGIATILLTVVQLVQAGLEFESIVKKVQAMEAAGSTPDEIAAWLKDLRVKAQKALADELAKG